MFSAVGFLKVIIFSPLFVFSADLQVLNEKKIVEIHREQSLINKSLAAQKQSSDLNSSLLDESYQARLHAKVSYAHSAEKATNPFQPVISPAQDWNLSVEQNLRRGVGVSVGFFGSQNSAVDNSFSDATQVGAKAQISFDLWKNFLGRKDQKLLKSAQAQKNRAELNFKIESHSSEIEARKIFWSLVAVEQSIELAKQLLISAEKQLQDAIKRNAAGVADRGEVARYRSQVDSRNSSVLLFQYEKELLWQGLDQQWDQFQSRLWKIELKEGDLKSLLVQQCISKISTSKEVPVKSSFFDEISELLQQETEAELKLADTHSSVDLQLFAQAQTTGVSNSYSKAQKDLSDERRAGYAVGVQLTVPLGSASTRSEAALKLIKKNSLQAQSLSFQKQLSATHETMVKSLELLSLGLKNQIQNSKNLQINYQEVQKKFQQGRIPVSTLILEQDALFQSQLQEISFKKQLAHSVLSYFKIFSEFDCEWNQL
jgi:outer membrane protein TolC